MKTKIFEKKLKFLFVPVARREFWENILFFFFGWLYLLLSWSLFVMDVKLSQALPYLSPLPRTGKCTFWQYMSFWQCMSSEFTSFAMFFQIRHSSNEEGLPSSSGETL